MKNILWSLTIAAVCYFAYNVGQVAVATNNASANLSTEAAEVRKELAAARKEAKDMYDGMPAQARAASNQATGGAIDAANPLKNGAREIKKGFRRIGIKL